MSKRHAPERIHTRAISMPDWSGALSRTDTITGHLTCSMTGWRLALTATPDGNGVLHITAQFDGPTMADDAAPWTDEYEMAKPHQYQPGGYDCMWVGTIRSADRKKWTGELADCYGGRLILHGKTEREGVISLRAAVSMVEECRG